ncbi:MAG: flagellar basal body-associated FliL family protein [Gammaproteobacteria bacterium]|nr:flagellar basal body-associated FliL family protein [Gammaproteobacteria bacterium]
MAEEATETDTAEAAAGGGMKKMIMIGGALALIGGGVFAGMTFMGGDEPQEGDEVAEAAAVSEAPALYQSLHPPLVVNFKDNAGDSHFMQVTMEVMSRDQEVINAVREHTPVIRNALILLYSGAIYDEVTTRDGKQQMLADGLAEIQTIMTERIGEPGVEAVYFTALVIQ